MTEENPTASTGLIDVAMREAQHLRNDHVGTEHLLLGLLAEDGGGAREILNAMGLTADRLRTELRRLSRPVPGGPKLLRLPVTPRVKQALEAGADAARRTREGVLRSEHVLLGLLDQEDGLASRALRQFSVDVAECRRLALTRLAAFDRSVRAAPPREVSVTALEAFGIDLSSREGAATPAIPQIATVPVPALDRALLSGMMRRELRGTLLLGPGGCGKTAAALRLAAALGGNGSRRGIRRLIAIPLSGLVAGAQHRGRIEERTRSIFGEAAAGGDCALFLDNLEALVPWSDLGAALGMAMDAFPVPVVGALDSTALSAFEAVHGGLRRRFVCLRVPSLPESALRGALDAHVAALEKHHAIAIPPEVRGAALDRAQPPKLSSAISLLDAACARARARTLMPGDEVRSAFREALRLERDAERACAEGEERRRKSLESRAVAARAAGDVLLVATSAAASALALSISDLRIHPDTEDE